MKIENIDIEATIEKAWRLVTEDKNLSAATQSMIEIMILIITLLANCLNPNAADVVVVSQTMKDELIDRGIEAGKVLVNPNCVDPALYSPSVNGNQIRYINGFHKDQIVIGFIGTFGQWHGAEILSEACGMLLQKFLEYRQRVKMLMIGDGPAMPKIKENLKKYCIEDSCVLTGLIPQEDGPAHLAACDILASPHVPNPDDTPFFGSPTKLFEYMAMGNFGNMRNCLLNLDNMIQTTKATFLI